jgi:hypothetical protein
MRAAEFRRLLACLNDLTPPQRRSLKAVLDLQDVDPESHIPDPEACPRCRGAMVRWGRVRGRQRWKCKACSRTFGRLTNTLRAGLRYRERWAESQVHSWTAQQSVRSPDGAESAPAPPTGGEPGSCRIW